MKIYTDIPELVKQEYTAATIGTFDGVHLGHMGILDVLTNDAKINNGRSFVITFSPHPRKVLAKDYDIKLLSTREERIREFKRAGVDCLLLISFTQEFASLSYEKFVEEYLVKSLGVSKLIIGYDHKFGRDRGGNEKNLSALGEKFNFEVEVVGEKVIDGSVVSSTLIRKHLLAGKIKEANKLLGRNYSFKAKVVVGAKRGRTLGFPTANLIVDNFNKLIPQVGVYLVKIDLWERQYFGIMNIGFRPTFGDAVSLMLEVHLLNFKSDIYDEEIEVEFIQRIRDEKKFDSKDELINQLNLDKKFAQDAIKLLTN